MQHKHTIKVNQSCTW